MRAAGSRKTIGVDVICIKDYLKRKRRGKLLLEVFESSAYRFVVLFHFRNHARVSAVSVRF